MFTIDWSLEISKGDLRSSSTSFSHCLIHLRRLMTNPTKCYIGPADSDQPGHLPRGISLHCLPIDSYCWSLAIQNTLRRLTKPDHDMCPNFQRHFKHGCKFSGLFLNSGFWGWHSIEVSLKILNLADYHCILHLLSRKTIDHLNWKLLIFCRHNASLKSEFLKFRIFKTLNFHRCTWHFVVLLWGDSFCCSWLAKHCIVIFL